MGFKLAWAPKSVSIIPQSENKQLFSHAQKLEFTLRISGLWSLRQEFWLAWAIQ